MFVPGENEGGGGEVYFRNFGLGRSHLRLILYGPLANILCFRPSVPYYGLEIPTSISKRFRDQNGKNLSVLITPSLISDTQHNTKIMMAVIHTPFQTMQ